MTDKKSIIIKVKTPLTQSDLHSSTSTSTSNVGVENIYKRIQQREHILLRPGTYVGSVVPAEQEMWIYDELTQHMIKRKIIFSPGLYKIYDEGLVNMRDHFIRMRDIIAEQTAIIAGTCPNNPKIQVDRRYYPVKKIEISVDAQQGQIIFRNDGDGIDVAFHENEKMYVPELIFGVLLTGTNFDQGEKRTVGGMNGYGSKLINIFSTEFIVETIDAHRQLKYTQRFFNNMTAREDPVITKYKGAPYTQISFKPDFPRFGVTNLTDDLMLLMKKRAYDIAACTSKEISVWYNGQKIEVKTFERYVDLYIGSRGECRRIYQQVNADWEVIVCSSPDHTFEHVSFVNAILTYRGGKHVDHASNIISSRLAKFAVENKKGMSQITAKSIKDNMWIFVNATMVNPDFDTQTKEFLSTNISDFRSRCDVDEDFIVKLSQSKVGILDKAIRLSEFKAGKGLKKSDGKKVKRVKNDKVVPAIYAGDKKKSIKCTLILTEGDSAQTTAVAGLAALPDEERKYYGVMPLRGKIINPKDSKLDTIEANKEFVELKQLLGLTQGADYTTSRDSLRYGRIILMTDADVDGDHIKALGFNLFHEFWPSLLRIEGFFSSILTPIVKVRHNTNKQLIKFYSLQEFEQWKKINETSLESWSPKYYKGLGTMTPTEAKECFANMQLQKYTWDCEILEKGKEKEKMPMSEEVVINHNSTSTMNSGTGTVSDTSSEETINPETYMRSFDNYYKNMSRHPCDLAIELAFSKKNADNRKGWMTHHLQQKSSGQIKVNLHEHQTMSYYEFINEKLVDYSLADTERSIPNLIDGLKPSQRKVIFTVLTKPPKKTIKVSELAGLVSAKTAYHHGESSMVETIVGLAQDFPGSNNLNLMIPAGQFGSRKGKADGIGKDFAAPRYIETTMTPITRFIFNKTDENLYRYLDDDGKMIEPEFYIPILPMVLINGARGIGTGWSTEIPCYNPIDVIENIKRYLQGQPMNEMIPWFRGFRGTIVKISHQKYQVTGCYRRTGPTTLEVTELPIGNPKESYSFLEYKNYIESLIIDPSVTDEKLRSKQILQDAETLHSDKTIKSLLIFPNEDSLTSQLNDITTFEKTFKLSHKLSTSNMNLFNTKGVMEKYVNPEDILIEYCQYRIKYYGKRKDYLLRDGEEKLLKLSEKIRFITYINDEQHELKVQKRRKTEIIQMLEKYTFAKISPKKKKGTHSEDDGSEEELTTTPTYEYLLKMRIDSLTLDMIIKLQKEYDELKNQLNQLRETTLQQMWNGDLEDLHREMSKFEDNWCKDYSDLGFTPRNIPKIPIALKPTTTFKVTSQSEVTNNINPLVTEPGTKIMIKIKKSS